MAGTAELRDAIVHRHAVDFDSDYRREEVIASTGGKHALFNAIQVLVDHGDEVILPVPYWVSFKDIVRYAGGNCVLLESDEAQGFRVTAEMVARLITPRTKVIILNSPSNPSGAVMSPEDMTEVVRLAHERGIWVLSDECYVYLNYTGKNFSVGSLREYKERFVVLGSLSKTYAMTGWRLGYALAPAAVTSAMAKLQSQSTSNPTSIVQKAAVAALKGPQECVAADAARIHRAARSCGERPARDSGRDLHDAGRCVLCLSEYFVVLRARRPEVRVGRGRTAVARGARGDGSGRRLRHAASIFAFRMPRRRRSWIAAWSACGNSSRRFRAVEQAQLSHGSIRFGKGRSVCERSFLWAQLALCMGNLYPLLMLPAFDPRPWGTLDLSPIYPNHKFEEKIGEAWLSGDDCKVANGPLTGKRWRS